MPRTRQHDPRQRRGEIAMIVDEPVDLDPRNCQQFSVPKRKNAGGMRLARQQRHFTHRFAAADIADDFVIGPVNPFAHDDQPARQVDIKRIGGRPLGENLPPARQRLPLARLGNGGQRFRVQAGEKRKAAKARAYFVHMRAITSGV